MQKDIDSFSIGAYKFFVTFDPDGELGGETGLDIEYKKEKILTRIFYFDEALTDSIERFANDFVANKEFREECLNGTARWARVNECFSINNWVYMEEYIDLWYAKSTEETKLVKKQISAAEKQLKKLYLLTKKNIDLWEQDMPCLCDEIDEEIAMPVSLMSMIPGVRISFSCQGARSLICPQWKAGPIWIPGEHTFHAQVVFNKIPAQIGVELDNFLKYHGVGTCNKKTEFYRAEALFPEQNAKFCKALEQFAHSRIAFLSNKTKNSAGISTTTIV